MSPRPKHAPVETRHDEPAAAELTELERIHHDVVAALKTIADPEIPVNIYDLGLIYNVEVWPTHIVSIKMTLATPDCPEVDTLPLEVQAAVLAVPGVSDCIVDLVWYPPWNPQLMSEAAKLELGMI